VLLGKAVEGSFFCGCEFAAVEAWVRGSCVRAWSVLVCRYLVSRCCECVGRLCNWRKWASVDCSFCECLCATWHWLRGTVQEWGAVWEKCVLCKRVCVPVCVCICVCLFVPGRNAPVRCKSKRLDWSACVPALPARRTRNVMSVCRCFAMGLLIEWHCFVILVLWLSLWYKRVLSVENEWMVLRMLDRFHFIVFSWILAKNTNLT